MVQLRRLLGNAVERGVAYRELASVRTVASPPEGHQYLHSMLNQLCS